MAEQEKINVSTPYVGMNLENDPASIENGEFSFVLNAVMNEGFGEAPHVSNMPSTMMAVTYPDGFVHIGNGPVDSERRVVFLAKTNGSGSQIGFATKQEYTTIVNDPKLGFRVDSQIQVKVKRSYNGDYYVYWVDFHNPIRVMNLTNPPFIRIKGPGGIITTGDLDIDQLKLFKNYDLPEVEPTELLNVGKLLSGGYYLCMQYADARGNGLTAWHRLRGRIAIIRDSISDSYENITGCKSNIPTNKAIKIKFKGTDLSFTHINMGVIRVIDGTPASYKVATIPTVQEEYIYTGANTEIPVPLVDILMPATVYDTAKTIEESDGSLIIGNLKGKKKLNIQPYINQIQIQWQAYRTFLKSREHSHKNPIWAHNNQCYRRDEVVPLGVVIEWNDGTESEVYPLIGRELNKRSNGSAFTQNKDLFNNSINPSEWDSQVMPTSDDGYENTSLPRWKMYNTATIEGDKGTEPRTESLSYYGECAYWESTETYPDNPEIWGAVAGKPIRFPKMPDLSLLPLMNIEIDGSGGGGFLGGILKRLGFYVYYLGFLFPNIDEVMNGLPEEIRSQMKGWRIVRADRKFNKSIIASGLLFNCFEQEFKENKDADSDIRLYPNYPFNDLRSDRYINRAYSGTSGIFGRIELPNTEYRKDIFTFLSPDTTLQKAALANGELKIEGEYSGQALCYHRWVSPFPKLREKGNENSRAAVQGIGLGEYGTQSKPVYGNTRRKLTEAMYIPFDSYVSGGNASRPIWNKGRESTVLLAINKGINNPVTQDRSRFIMTNEDNAPSEEQFRSGSENANIALKVTRPISSHYASIKVNIPNQYGNIFNIKWVDTGYTQAKYAATGIVFGGDTYIGQFADKRQMVFYNTIQDWMFAGDGADGLDLRGNMSLPSLRYYYRNAGSNPRKDSKMMLEDNSGWFGGDSKDLGYICLFMHGVPLFWTESDININLRLEGDQEPESIYPSLHDGATQVQNWLGIKNISKDNYHENNADLSGYNDLSYIQSPDPLYDPGKNDITHYSTRVIKSLRSQPEDIYDNWQIFKPLDYYDFSKSRGALWDMRYVGQGRTLFRFERSIQYSSLQQVIASSEGQVTLGSGRLFAQDPQELLHTDLGYGGTRSQWAFNLTEFGAFFVDSENGKVFNFASGIQEISNNKAAVWFRQNLPFKLSRDISGIPTDNPANPEGIGLHSAWDPKHNLWILTKKDYEVVDKNTLNQYRYESGRILFNGVVVSPKIDTELFANRSWSIAYSPLTKRWFTFYSFIPDAYIPDTETVLSVCIEDGTSVVHRHDNPESYLNIYGRKVPFILETVNRLDGLTGYISATSSFVAKAFSLRNNELVPVLNRSFSKAIIYNAHQCTGILNLIIQDENNLYMLRRGLQQRADSKDVALRLRRNMWNFSDYFDIAKADSFFTTNWKNDKYQQAYFIDKVLNDVSLNYNYPFKQAAMIKGLWTKTRLILDNTEDLKLLFQVSIEQPRVSYS